MIAETNILRIYREKTQSGELTYDAEQENAAMALRRLQEDLQNPRRGLFGLGKVKPFKGVYIYGGVGRGKSMLMDLFFSTIPSGYTKRRVHFHAFMIETHDWLHGKRSTGTVDDLIPDYARHVAKTVDVLCFDEFHVTDVADAMILSRLFTHLFDMGVAFVATSNWPPDKLYEGGLQRVRFLPFIDLLKHKAEIVFLDSDTDYREMVVNDLDTYLYPLDYNAKRYVEDFFKVLSQNKAPADKILHIKGRDLHVRTAGGVARFTFAELCEKALGAEDYLAIAQEFHSVFIENIPKMGYDRRNEAKRFMTLIDVLYDTRRRVVMTAEAAPDKLYSGHDYEFEFDRTVSRLREMQSSSYLKNTLK